MESDDVETEPSQPQQLLLRSSPLVTAEDPVCNSAICKTAAARILSMMNHSAEPCDDFYEFSCGNFYETEENYDEKVLEQLNSVQVEKYLGDFKKFYGSCVKHEDYFDFQDRIKKLEGMVHEVGQFQFGNDSYNLDLTELVSTLLLRQSMPLFDIGLDVDKENFTFQVNLPHQNPLRTSIQDWSALSLLKKRCLEEQKLQIQGSHINLTNVYKLFENCQADYSLYLNSLESVIRELSVFKNLDATSLEAEIKHIRFSIEFEVLNKLDSLPSADTILKETVTKDYTVRSVQDLQTLFPVLQWQNLFERLTGRPVDVNTKVQIYFSDYFKNVFDQLSHVDSRQLNNAFLAIYAYDLFVNTVMPKETSTRSVFCTDLSKKLFPDVWSHIVQKTLAPEEQKFENKQLSRLFEELKFKFCRTLLKLEWVGTLGQNLYDKCAELKLELFVPPQEESLEENYRGLNMTEDFQTNVVKLLENYKKVVYSKGGTAVTASTIFSYFLDPLSTEPMTFYSNKIIVAPLGLMKKSPFGLPEYLTKIRVGLALGRQLARHFDPTGITYGASLTSTAKSSYSEFVHTMTNLMDYSSPRMFDNKNISFYLNGSLSLNERIVDNGAFRLVLDVVNFSAKKNILPWITHSWEKVFFIATAQEFCKKTSILDFMLEVFEKPHLPAVLRVENVIGNSEQFAEQFGCPDGSGMDFSEKIQFPYLSTIEDDYESEI